MTMTIQKCLHICRRKGFQFSGLQWQIECYCGNLPTDGFEWAWPEKCDERCAGDSNQMCGGSMAMNLYNTPRNILCGLCVYDDPEKRVFGGPSIIGQNDMTIEKCKHLCSNYKFFGVQAGDECHCGDSDENLLPSPEIQCDTSCKGNVSQICGGSWRMNVYKTFERFDLVFGSSIPAILEKIIPDENISDQIRESSTNSPVYTTEMITFDDDSALSIDDELIRYSDTADIFMPLTYYAYYYEYWYFSSDYNDPDHSHFMHVSSRYAFVFDPQAASIYYTNSTMITVIEEAFLEIPKTITIKTKFTVSTTTTTTMTTTKATSTTKDSITEVMESLVDDLMNATMPTEMPTTKMPTTEMTMANASFTPIICSPYFCKVTEWISKDKPTGTGDHESFK